MLGAGELALLERIDVFTAAARSLLCALARRGKAIVAADPTRSSLLLSSVVAHPLYKVGRLFFDMAELEDLMLDGPAPTRLTDARLTELLQSFGDSIRGVTNVLVQVDSGARESSGQNGSADGQGTSKAGSAHQLRQNGEAGAVNESDAEPTSEAEEWPAIDASDYLFDLIVVGWMSEVSKLRAVGAPADGT